MKAREESRIRGCLAAGRNEEAAGAAESESACTGIAPEALDGLAYLGAKLASRAIQLKQGKCAEHQLIQPLARLAMLMDGLGASVSMSTLYRRLVRQARKHMEAGPSVGPVADEHPGHLF